MFDDDRFFFRLFNLFSMYKDGFLPEEGGLNNQPALLLSYFEQLKMTNNILDKDDQDRAENGGGADSLVVGPSLLR